MPARHYRRKIRKTGIIPRFLRLRYTLTSRIVLGDITQTTTTNVVETIQQYFYDIIDAIIQQSELNIIIEKANEIITIFSKKEEVYKVLDLIEENALGIVKNLTEGAPINIIECRIEYLRKLLNDIPEEYQDYGEIGCLINEILTSITDEVDFSIVIENIETIQSAMSENVALINAIDAIEENLFSIIKNITEGMPINIIESRIEYLQKLVSELPCSPA